MITGGRPYWSTCPMHEYVVPRSMPKTLLATENLHARAHHAARLHVQPDSRCTSTSATRTTDPSARANPTLIVLAIVPSADVSVVGIRRPPMWRAASDRSPGAGADGLTAQVSAVI